jgi:hypothetical protein
VPASGPLQEIANYHPATIAVLLVAILTFVVWHILSNRNDTEVTFHNVWRFSDTATEYSPSSTNEITIQIPDNVSESMSEVNITVKMPFDAAQLAAESVETPITVADCCTHWPALHPPTSGRRTKLPITVRNAKAIITKQDVPSEEKEVAITAVEQNRDGVVRFNIQFPLPIHQDLSFLRISFDSMNIFTSLGERRPYDRSRLIIDITPRVNDYKSFASIDYPEHIGLRGRRDNSEYYSVSAGKEVDRQRNVAFFSESSVSMKYTFGTDDAVTLASPAIPFFYAGFSLLAAALSLHLLNRPPDPATVSDSAGVDLGRLFLAAISIILNRAPAPDAASAAAVDSQLTHLQFLGGLSFVISTTTTILEVARSRRFLFATSVSGHNSWDNWALFLCAATQLAMVSLVAYTLGWQPDWSHVVERFTLGLGIGLFGVWIVCMVLLTFGILQGYICDECEGRLWGRVFTRVDHVGDRWWWRIFGRPDWTQRQITAAERRQALCFWCQREIPHEERNWRTFLRMGLSGLF